MIPKFEDFLKEGFLSKTYDRYRNGTPRTEELEFFKSEDLYQPISNNRTPHSPLKTHVDFKDYYLKDEFDGTLIFHYPKTKPIAKFKEMVIPGNGTCRYENLEFLNNPKQEEKDTIESKEFMDAISDWWMPF